ncbi:hypothetical protein GGR57DRAFT_356162 [Xylariaceae sp. FL1272]|nr:hypothetical protein GGR57DRAFT_356162 [Xylariaceae sp. FL1272]
MSAILFACLLTCSRCQSFGPASAPNFQLHCRSFHLLGRCPSSFTDHFPSLLALPAPAPSPSPSPSLAHSLPPRENWPLHSFLTLQPSASASAPSLAAFGPLPVCRSLWPRCVCVLSFVPIDTSPGNTAETRRAPTPPRYVH